MKNAFDWKFADKCYHNDDDDYIVEWEHPDNFHKVVDLAGLDVEQFILCTELEHNGPCTLEDSILILNVNNMDRNNQEDCLNICK